MRCTLRLLTAVAFSCLPLLCQSPGVYRSQLAPILNFEAGPAGGSPQGLPHGWGGGPPETIFMDDKIVHSGRWAVRLERNASSADKFSTITIGIPEDFTGTRVEFRGFLKTEDVSEFAGLWMREDGDGGAIEFDNMESRHLKGTHDWAEYSIVLPLRSEAKQLFFGVLISGTGKTWADGLQLLVDRKPVSEAAKAEPPKTALDTDHEFDKGSRIALHDLTAVQIENLATLGKVWGFLKYHHPQVTSGRRHFDYDLFRVLPVILAAPDRSAANAALVRWIAGLGEIGPCDACAKVDEHDLQLRPDLNWISDDAALGADLSRTLCRIRANRPAYGTQFYVSLTPGVANPSFDHEPEYSNIELPDAGFQLLALYRFWNIIQYWYPYRNAIGEDWGAVLAEFVQRIALARDRQTYQREMMALIARVNDTHANLWGSLAVRPPIGTCQLPVNIRFVENQAVVTGYSNPDLGKATGLKPGDVIQELDGVEVPKLVNDWRPYYADSNEPARLRDIGSSMTHGDCFKPAALRVRRANETLELSASRVSLNEIDFKTARHDQPGETLRRLSPDVAYLKLSSVKIAEAAHYIDSAAGTKGLIVDIRNYPSEFVVFALGELLVDKPTEFARFTQGDLANPGAFHWGHSVSLEPKSPHYAGKVVILVDEVSQSQAEYTTMAFRIAPGAAVIGSTTAGADGNVSPIPLPGGLHSMISGIGVFYPDKKPTQRIGIVVDEQVTPTIAGIRAGRDEVLEAAIRRVLGPETPAAVIEKLAEAPNVPVATFAKEFSDAQSGISLKLPDGWSAREPSHWGDHETTVRLAGAPPGSFASLYFQVLHDQPKLTKAEIDKLLHGEIESKQVQRRREGASNYTIRAGGCSDRTISGHSALSCIADFGEDGHAMAEYLTWVRSEELLVLFFGDTPAAGLDAFRKSFERVIEAISIP
jgi:C-terminal processing protease CtpA/Prc